MFAIWAVVTFTVGRNVTLAVSVFALAILLGWLAAGWYRQLEMTALAKALKKGRKDLAPWSDGPPLFIVVFGLLEGEDCDEEPWLRDGPAYGWVPMALGLGVLITKLYFEGFAWPVCIGAIGLFLVAASVEDPLVRHRLAQRVRREVASAPMDVAEITRLKREFAKWGSSDDISSFELLVPAILVAWATVEFTAGTPLGAIALWAVATGWTIFTALVAWGTGRGNTPRSDMAISVGLTFWVASMILPFVAAIGGWLSWSIPIGYIIGIAMFIGSVRLSGERLLIEGVPAKTPDQATPIPYKLQSPADDST